MSTCETYLVWFLTFDFSGRGSAVRSYAVKNIALKYDSLLGYCIDSLALWWRQYAPLKHQPTCTRLHCVISQRAVIFILATLRTWNLTMQSLFQPWSILTIIMLLWSWLLDWLVRQLNSWLLILVGWRNGYRMQCWKKRGKNSKKVTYLLC